MPLTSAIDNIGLTASIAATALIVMIAACSTGPEPRPVADSQADPGEQTARQAGEAARERREQDETILYATSRDVDDTDEDLDDGDLDEDDPEARPGPTVLTIHLDPEGRLIDPDGRPVDPETLDERTDDPLEDRALRLVIDPEAREMTIETLSPFFEAVDGRDAFLEIREGEAPEVTLDDADEEQPDEEQPDGEETDAS